MDLFINGKNIEANIERVSVDHTQAIGIGWGENVTIDGVEYQVIGIERNSRHLALVDIRLAKAKQVQTATESSSSQATTP